jgi:hypothetical protein
LGENVKSSIAALVATLGVALPGICCANDSYSFDSVTAVRVGFPQVAITGVLKNTTGSITVTFNDQVAEGMSQYASRCVPILITALDKPGKYYLNLVVDPADHYFQIVSCELELRQ